MDVQLSDKHVGTETSVTRRGVSTPPDRSVCHFPGFFHSRSLLIKFAVPSSGTSLPPPYIPREPTYISGNTDVEQLKLKSTKKLKVEHKVEPSLQGSIFPLCGHHRGTCSD